MASGTLDNRTPTGNTPKKGVFGSSVAYTKSWPLATEASATYDQATVEDFTSQGAGSVLGLTKIEGLVKSTCTQALQVAWTTDTTRFDVTEAEEWYSISVDSDEPATTAVYLCVSWDGRLTWYAFVSSAWVCIAKLDGVWKYRSAAPATYSAASTNDMSHALREAFGVSANRMTSTALEAVTAAQWAGTNGFVQGYATLDLAWGQDANGLAIPVVKGFSCDYKDTGTSGVEYRSGGEWTEGSGWTDGTKVGDVPLAQDGIIAYAGPYAEIDYGVVSDVPAFWMRVKPTSGTSVGTAITRILYKGPCQPLKAIAVEGIPDMPLCVIYEKSNESWTDIRPIVTDDIQTELSKVDIPLTADDKIIIVGGSKYNAIEIWPWIGNDVAATLTAKYWDGEEYIDLTITDGTASIAGATLQCRGKIEFIPPDDWRMCIPKQAGLPRGYAIELTVSTDLNSSTSLSEVRVYPIPNDMVKHRFAATVKDRIALLNRTDAPNQCDLSRVDEPWGFWGGDAPVLSVGGQDGIQCAFPAWDGLFVGKAETWHNLIGSTEQGFWFQGVEAARCVPVSSRAICKAPMPGSGDGARNALVFLNQFGVWAAMGLQADGSFASGRIVCLSDNLDYWNQDADEHLDLNYLWRACCEYSPLDNVVYFAVPMVISPATTQTTNNRLLPFDVSMGAWLPPQDIAVASMCVAYDYNANTPGRLGPIELLAGDYAGRIVRLGNGADDNGTEITGFIETGHLDCGLPEFQKELRFLRIFGKTGGDNLQLSVYLDGSLEAETPTVLTDVAAAGTDHFVIEYDSTNLKATLFKFRIDFTGTTDVYGIEFGWYPVRTRQGSGG